MLPYLATVPHVDKGAHGVEGARPAGQQVCPVVGMQHTDIVGTVSLGGQQGRGRVTGYWCLAHPQPPASAWDPTTVGEPQPWLRASSLVPGIWGGSLCPLTGLVWTSSGWSPAHCKRTGLFPGPSAAKSIPGEPHGIQLPPGHLLPAGTCALTLSHSPR